MNASRIRRFVTTFVILVSAASGAAQRGQDTAADLDRLAAALELRPGSVVAEMGAGDGALTIAVAGVVGSGGRVFSNELNPTLLAALGPAAREAGLENVTPIPGRTDGTNLPDACCDAIFMRDVYHHFTEPAAMNASLLRSLRPGGRLAVLDFGPPPGGESDDPAGRARDGHHGVTAPTIERELKAAGFEILSTGSYGFRNFMVIARRPAG
jgi:ubiquinone/menaquinone biosynthesis C-methylase UbiE